jgi:hypothetical protein
MCHIWQLRRVRVWVGVKLCRGMAGDVLGSNEGVARYGRRLVGGYCMQTGRASVGVQRRLLCTQSCQCRGLADDACCVGGGYWLTLLANCIAQCGAMLMQPPPPALLLPHAVARTTWRSALQQFGC